MVLEKGNSAHIYHLDDDKFRLTFISTSAGGAIFSSEIGDFDRWGIDDWLKDGHLHPSTDFEALLDSFEKQTESTVQLVPGTVLRTHCADGIMVKSPATIEDVCRWLSEYQQQYFGDQKITISVDLQKNTDLKATACFCQGYPKMGSIMVSSELLQFCNCLKISLLHELIHANLHADGKHDPDDDHGPLFRAEVKRLMNMGAYDPLL